MGHDKTGNNYDSRLMPFAGHESAGSDEGASLMVILCFAATVDDVVVAV